MSNSATWEPTNAVGLRELRGRLSSYVDEVKVGRSYTLTEHGKPIARLIPVTGASAYEQLVAQGVIQPAARRPSRIDPPVATLATVSDLVSEQRR